MALFNQLIQHINYPCLGPDKRTGIDSYVLGNLIGSDEADAVNVPSETVEGGPLPF